MRAVLFFLILLTLPQTLGAEASFVQSGEHDGFTRLVAEVPDAQSWDVRRESGRVELRLRQHQDGFDTARVYDRIGKERVAQLEATSDTLSIVLGCDCQVSAFPVSDTHAVIDIGSPGVTLPMPVIAEQAFPNLLVPDSTLTAGAVSPDSRTTTGVFDSTGDLQRTELDDAQSNILDSVQEELMRELGAAASNGLLTPDRIAGQAPKIDVQIDRSMLDTEATPKTPQKLPERMTANMRVTSSIDLPPGKRRILDTLSARGAPCPSEGALSVLDWGNDAPFYLQLSKARQGLYGEFDKLNEDAALRLAQTYLFFGFGAEAAQVLGLFPEAPEHLVYLRTMSDIFEFGQVPSDNPFDRVIECTPMAAMWSILGGDLPRDKISEVLDEALLALNGLPTHLRQILAPLLSQRLGAAGFADGAASAFRSLERLPPKLSPGGQLAEAKMLLEQEEVQEAIARLEGLIEKNDEHTPEALITLVNHYLENGQPVTYEMAELVEAYATELSGGPLGPVMRQAHVAALIQSSQFDRAFKAFDLLGGQADDPAANNLRRYLMQALIDRADDIVFLQYAFEQLDDEVARLALNDRLRLAERMLTLGFPLEAQNALNTIPDRPRNDARQHLAARIALDLGQPFRAQAELIGIESPEAVGLLAEAKLIAGDGDEAHDLYQRAGNKEEALRAAWLSEDWRNLTPPDTPVFGPAATLPRIAEGDPTAPEGMLARSADALEASTQARRALEELLAATQTEDEPGN